MAITNGYVSLVEMKGWLNIDDTSDDTELELAIEAASRAVDDWCRRRFHNATETRYYTPCTSEYVEIDDLITVTTLKTDVGGDGTFETTWDSADYRLEPLNAAVPSSEPRPYTRVARAHGSSKVFYPTVEKSVEIVGSFGWPSAAPTAVKQATLLQASRLWRRGKDAPLGVVHLPGLEGASGMRLHAKIDVDVQVLLAEYRRTPVMVA